MTTRVHDFKEACKNVTYTRTYDTFNWTISTNCAVYVQRGNEMAVRLGRLAHIAWTGNHVAAGKRFSALKVLLYSPGSSTPPNSTDEVVEAPGYIGVILLETGFIADVT